MMADDLRRLADELQGYLDYLKTADTDREAAEDTAQEVRDRLLLEIARYLAAVPKGMPGRWQVCTSCGLKSGSIESGENWHLGQPATVQVEDGILYVTPHRPDCASMHMEIARRQGGA